MDFKAFSSDKKTFDAVIRNLVGISKQIVWETIKSDLPDLEFKIKKLIDKVG